MDKSTFETYEFLPTNPEEPESDQFLVVQDDGTFLLNRQIQYVTQVQDVKEALNGVQGCTVYDVNPQQFFFDVTDNQTELISVADNYILPVTEEASNNLYSNSFLLQTVPNDKSEVGSDLTIQLRETGFQEISDENAANKPNNNCTQITITDEQYKSLQQKGWVLLKTSDKIFILDTFGLHDITNNEDLIKKLKNANPLNINLDGDDKRPLKLEIDSSLLKLENVIIQEELPTSSINFIKEPDNYEDATKIDGQDAGIATKEIKNEDTAEQKQTNLEKDNLKNEAVEAKKISTSGNLIKIKTKHCFKGIPEKMILGKTVNGKNLVAKLLKQSKQESPSKKCSLVKSKDTDLLKDCKNPINNLKDNLISDDSQFENLLQQALYGAIECSEEQIAAAKEIVAQLFQVPAFQSSVAGRNVIITKVVEKKLDDSTVQIQGSSCFVTGVITATDAGSCCFTHVPNLMQKLMTRYLESQASRSVLKSKLQGDYTVLHVHICEKKDDNNIEAISVMLNERMLPWKVLANKRPPSRIARPLYACSSCASIFQSKQELDEHQEAHTLESEDALTIDTDKLPENSLLFSALETPYIIIKSDLGTEYACIECAARFNKLSNCLRHVHTHTAQKTDSDCDDKSNQTTGKKSVFKCKMCNCSFFHPSSLSKHISKVHIKEKVIKYL